MQMPGRGGQMMDVKRIHFLYAYLLMCAVAYPVFLIVDYRGAPREMATLLALHGDTDTAVPRLELTRPVFGKGRIVGYSVTYAFRSADGGQHALTQRVDPDQWPLKLPLVVTYARRWPGLATLDVAISRRRAWEAAVIPPLYAAMISCFSILGFGIIWASKSLGNWRRRRREARKVVEPTTPQRTRTGS